MFSFLRRSRRATDEVNTTQCGTRMVSFDPSGIVRAISFHLLEEGKARVVNRESSEAATHKLSQRFVRVAISADQWAAMDNVQRLQWLLKQSHIVVKSGLSGSCMLSVRRWPALVTTELLWGRQ